MTYKMLIDNKVVAQSDDIILFAAQGEIALINYYGEKIELSLLEEFIHSC